MTGWCHSGPNQQGYSSTLILLLHKSYTRRFVEVTVFQKKKTKKAMFSCEKILDFDTVALSFVFDNYYLNID